MKNKIKIKHPNEKKLEDALKKIKNKTKPKKKIKIPK